MSYINEKVKSHFGEGHNMFCHFLEHTFPHDEQVNSAARNSFFNTAIIMKFMPEFDTSSRPQTCSTLTWNRLIWTKSVKIRERIEGTVHPK